MFYASTFLSFSKWSSKPFLFFIFKGTWEFWYCGEQRWNDCKHASFTLLSSLPYMTSWRWWSMYRLAFDWFVFVDTCPSQRRKKADSHIIFSVVNVQIQIFLGPSCSNACVATPSLQELGLWDLTKFGCCWSASAEPNLWFVCFYEMVSQTCDFTC